MDYGFVKVAAAVPSVKVADCFYNMHQIEGLMRQAATQHVQIIAFPELSITAYTCLDLFQQETLLRQGSSIKDNPPIFPSRLSQSIRSKHSWL